MFPRPYRGDLGACDLVRGSVSVLKEAGWGVGQGRESYQVQVPLSRAAGARCSCRLHGGMGPCRLPAKEAAPPTRRVRSQEYAPWLEQGCPSPTRGIRARHGWLYCKSTWPGREQNMALPSPGPPLCPSPSLALRLPSHKIKCLSGPYTKHGWFPPLGSQAPWSLFQDTAQPRGCASLEVCYQHPHPLQQKNRRTSQVHCPTHRSEGTGPRHQ